MEPGGGTVGEGGQGESSPALLLVLANKHINSGVDNREREGGGALVLKEHFRGSS